MFLPDINLSRTSAWYKDGDTPDLSLDDSQVCTCLHLPAGCATADCLLHPRTSGTAYYPHVVNVPRSPAIRSRLSSSQVLIRRGELLTGVLCKKSLGTTGGGLVHVTWMEHGPDQTRRLINNCQLTVNHWLLHWGMSIGIADTVADDATMTTINDIIEKAKEEVKKIINIYQSGELEQMPGRTLQVRACSAWGDLVLAAAAGCHLEHTASSTRHAVKLLCTH
jgi:DNA-directed RNA polymerase II subunit RPB1